MKEIPIETEVYYRIEKRAKAKGLTVDKYVEKLVKQFIKAEKTAKVIETAAAQRTREEH